MFDFIEQEKSLGYLPLTVLAQAISPNDNGQLLWDIFFPRKTVDSVKLANIHDFIWRPVADRREWNDTGRLIHQPTPKADQLEMVPIEAYFRLGEREIQDLQERVNGNVQVFRDLVKISIPQRVAVLAQACYRRLEVDSFTAWANGQIVARDAKTNRTSTFDFGYDTARYQTAGPAWTGGNGGTAFGNLVAWLQDIYNSYVGGFEGVMLRWSTLQAIIESAPYGINAVQRSLLETEQLIQGRLGQDFRFFLNERTVEPYTGSGTAYSSTKIWPDHKVAVVPTGKRVGDACFAPIYRASAAGIGSISEAGVDQNGLSVFPEVEQNGRALKVECQGNILPVPEERLVAVIDAGI